MSAKRKKTTIENDNDVYVNFSISINKHTRDILKKYAKKQRRSASSAGGLFVEQALSAVTIEQESNVLMA